MPSPAVVALAGPNGAGKSTTGPPLLKETLGITQFVNADLIAEGLAAFDPAGAALTAGKVMLSRIKDLAGSRTTFAFETTLAGKFYARWLAELIQQGYLFHIVFLWLPSPEFALERVRDRVLRGGHAVPERTVRRRLGAPPPRLVAAGTREDVALVKDATTWTQLTTLYGEQSNAG